MAGLILAWVPDIVHGPTSIFSPAGTPAHLVFGLSELVLGVTLGIFLLVAGLLAFALVRYRHLPNDPQALREPAQIYGSNQIELSWTVIPILIVVMLFLATARIIYTTELPGLWTKQIPITISDLVKVTQSRVWPDELNNRL